MDNDSLMVALWKIRGVKKMLEICTTSDAFADTNSDDMFFVMSSTLGQAIDLIEKSQKINN